MREINKAQRRHEVREQVARLTDALGKPIDDGIFETVVSLNVLGIHTTASCAGHLDHGQAAPWVDIGDPEARPLARVAMLKMLEVDQARSLGALAEERHALQSAADQASLAVKRLHLIERARLLRVLDLFYQQHHAPADRRLIINPKEWTGMSRLESQGANFQTVAAPDERATKLTEYQEEMQTFATFLESLEMREQPT
ncbi:MAG: hypothetical protein ABI465_17175 [Ktedonobacteraceae bacterium]